MAHAEAHAARTELEAVRDMSDARDEEIESLRAEADAMRAELEAARTEGEATLAELEEDYGSSRSGPVSRSRR